MKCVAALGFALVACVYSQTQKANTTMAPHHHHGKEPYEMDQVYFQYDKMSHFLVARTSKYCYMLPITGMDQRAILTSAGLRSLEVRMYQMMDYAVHEALRGMDVIHLSPIVSKMCFNQTLVKIHD